MVKKTLLSMAIAATVVGLAGCNVSSTDKYDNNVDLTSSTAGQPGTTPSAFSPVFSPANSEVPLAIDFLFADAGDSDGTANTADSTPPVTTAINKLDGFSTVAPIYIEFNSEIDADTVVAGKTVFLVKLANSVDNSSIDALDIDTILAANPANPFSTKPITPADYEARAIDMNGTPAIQVLLKKPLEAKTKYLVVVTSGVKSRGGLNAGMSAEFSLVSGSRELPSDALAPVRGAVQGWQQLASAFLGSPLAANAEGSSVLSYTFTTGGTTDVLKAMAAPATFLTTQITDVAAAEYTITKSAVDTAVKGAIAGLTDPEQIAVATQAATEQALTGVAGNLDLVAGGVAAAIQQPTLTRSQVKADGVASSIYYKELIKIIADGQGSGVDAIVSKPKSRDYSAIMSTTGPVTVSYDAFLTAQITPKVKAGIEKQVRDNPALEGADEAVIQQQIDAAISANLTSEVSAQVTALSSKGAIYQGGLTIPNYLPASELVDDKKLGTWVASDAAAQALGLPAAPSDMKLADGSDAPKNVTYRFPFAKKVSDNVIPVFATLPSVTPTTLNPAGCAKPVEGYPVVIYQHGITVDRTAGVLVGNALANACVAMVAIDHTMHGVAPGNATDLLFSVNTIAEGAVDGDGNPTALAAKSPFAVARAGAEGLGSTFFASLKERHNNVGKNTAQENVEMSFASAGAEANVGASGDLYINLNNFARTRDAMRQTVLDMMNLSATIGAMDINGDGNNDLDADKVYFIGHSLGAIIGTTFVAVNNDPEVQAFSGKSASNPTGVPTIKGAILGNGGGGVVKLLENSPSIGAAKILPGLAAAGLEQGSGDIEKFFGVMQAMVDSADPINFASAEHMKTLPILSYEAVGGVGKAKPDSVVPNNALDATVATAKSYLAGTDPLVNLLGITTQYDQSTDTTNPQQDAEGIRANVRVGTGDHSTFSNADPQNTFKEIYGQIGSFILYSGKAVNVADTSVLEPVAE